MMSASDLVLEDLWSQIETSCEDSISCLEKTRKKQSELWSEEVSKGSPVTGESQRKEEYYCFPEHYCACYAFFYDTVTRGEQLCCKHQLAARLAAALGACLEVKIPDVELAVLLSKL